MVRSTTARRTVATGTVVAVLTALLVVAVPAVPADAVEVRTAGTERLLGGLSRQRLEVRLPDGSVARGNALRFSPDDPDLELRPALAQDTVAGLSRMSSLAAAERRRGAVAGVNGGYFLRRPWGAPNGLFVTDSRVIAGDSVSRSGLPAGRAVVGIRPDQSLLMDQLSVRLWMQLPDSAVPAPDEPTEPLDPHDPDDPLAPIDPDDPLEPDDPLDVVDPSRLSVDELNRQVRTDTDGTAPRDGELLVYDRTYGTRIEVPAGSVLLVVDDLALPSAGETGARVLERRVPTADTTWTVAPDTSVILAYGSRAPDLAGVVVGDTVGVEVEVVPFNDPAGSWGGLASALPGGGLLIRQGQVRSGASHTAEGLDHARTRRARTAIARLSGGTTMLVTIDETGGSSGLTLHELGRALRALGATDAVALDGGGSSTMTIDAATVNRPSDPNRGHSSGLFVYTATPPPTRQLEAACPAGVAPSAGFVDTAATVHVAAVDCLAWWQVTSGVTPQRFDPAGSVTRGQMATFLARWIDDLATRGSGRALAASAVLGFDDVRPDDVHAPAIARLAAVDIIRGRSSGGYDPAASVSRAETATLLRRALEYATATTLAAGRDTFVDDTGLVHEASLDQLAAIGVFGGIGGFSVAPDDDVSRGAMASLLMRAGDHLVERGVVAPPA